MFIIAENLIRKVPKLDKANNMYFQNLYQNL